MKNGVIMNYTDPALTHANPFIKKVIFVKKIYYFDNAASTPLHPEVLAVVTDTLSTIYGNPGSLHSIGRKARQVLTEARTSIAGHIGAHPEEIIFTSGACEGNSLALKGYMEHHKNTVLITTPIEHASIAALCKQQPEAVRYVPVDWHGFVDLDKLHDLCRKEYLKGTGHLLVSIQAANNEIGTIQNLKEISAIVHQYKGIFHTDATQLFPYEALDVRKAGIDMLSMSGQKINAPKGIGFLYVREGISLTPFSYGSQMEGRRGGTENIPYIAGLAKAVELLDYENDTMRRTRDYLITQMRVGETGFIINGSFEHRLPNHISISFQDIEGEALALLLDCHGICVSTSSACSAGSPDAFRVLQAIHVPEDYLPGTIRISLPRDITRKEINSFINILHTCLLQLRNLPREESNG